MRLVCTEQKDGAECDAVDEQLNDIEDDGEGQGLQDVLERPRHYHRLHTTQECRLEMLLHWTIYSISALTLCRSVRICFEMIRCSLLSI